MGWHMVSIIWLLVWCDIVQNMSFLPQGRHGKRMFCEWEGLSILKELLVARDSPTLQLAAVTGLSGLSTVP